MGYISNKRAVLEQKGGEDTNLRSQLNCERGEYWWFALFK